MAPHERVGTSQPPGFAVYQPAVGVDPYPDAPSAEGWSVRFGSDGRPTHGRLFDDCQRGEEADAAFRAAGPPAPRLPHNALLLFEEVEESSPPPACRTLGTVAVWAQPVLTAADVSGCVVTDLQSVELDLDRGRRVVRQVVVRMEWTPGGLAKLTGLGLSPSARLLPAAGVESLGEWLPAGSGELRPFAEFKVRGVSEADQRRTAAALCALVTARP
jgi:hypothetical protein